MAQNNLTQELRDNTSLAPHFNRAEQTGSRIFPNRVVIAVTDTGYRTDEKGTYEWIEGYPLSNDPVFYNANTNEINLVRVRRNTVAEGVKSIADKRSANNNMGTDDAIGNKLNSSYKTHRRSTLQELIGKDGAHPNGGTVVFADFPTNIETFQATSDPKGPRVVSFTANYVGVMNKYQPNEDRPSVTEQKIARMGFAQTEKRQDTVFMEVLEENETFNLKAQNDPDFKEDRKGIINFMGRALSNRDPHALPQHAQTASRTGFLMMKFSVLVNDGNGGKMIKELDSTLSKLYPSREELAGPNAFDPISGELKTVTVATSNVTTLTRLATATDKATTDYLQNPTNPELRRRAMEADVQRAFLHAVSGRPIFGEEEERKPLIAVSDPEHMENVAYIHEAACRGDLLCNLTSGTKVEFYQGRRLEEAAAMRQAYDQKYPDNPGRANLQYGKSAHRIYNTLIDAEGGTGTFGTFFVAGKPITEKTSTPGTMMFSQVKTADANSLFNTPYFTSTPDAQLINGMRIKHIGGKGFEYRNPSLHAKEFAKNNMPLDSNPQAAYERFMKESKNVVNAAPTPQSLMVSTLDGQMITNEDTSKIGIGLQAFLESDNILNAAPSNTNNDVSNMLEEKTKLDAQVESFAKELAERVKMVQEASVASPQTPAIEHTEQAAPKRAKPR